MEHQVVHTKAQMLSVSSLFLVDNLMSVHQKCWQHFDLDIEKEHARFREAMKKKQAMLLTWVYSKTYIHGFEPQAYMWGYKTTFTNRFGFERGVSLSKKIRGEVFFVEDFRILPDSKHSTKKLVQDMVLSLSSKLKGRVVVASVYDISFLDPFFNKGIKKVGSIMNGPQRVDLYLFQV